MKFGLTRSVLFGVAVLLVTITIVVTAFNSWTISKSSDKEVQALWAGSRNTLVTPAITNIAALVVLGLFYIMS